MMRKKQKKAVSFILLFSFLLLVIEVLVCQPLEKFRKSFLDSLSVYLAENSIAEFGSRTSVSSSQIIFKLREEQKSGSRIRIHFGFGFLFHLSQSENLISILSQNLWSFASSHSSCPLSGRFHFSAEQSLHSDCPFLRNTENYEKIKKQLI
jgi:hypothetical protein